MSELKENVGKLPVWAKYTLYGILGAAGAVLLGLLFGNIIMWLWNWLMPKFFGRISCSRAFRRLRSASSVRRLLMCTRLVKGTSTM